MIDLPLPGRAISSAGSRIISLENIGQTETVTRWLTMFTFLRLQLKSYAIQVLRNVDGGGGGSNFLGKSVTKVYGSTILALRGGGWGSKFQEKNVT